ncbi:MAG: PD40 domain-containing protein [Chloroflexi bacterium]|nr:PD40 domain-containing protein [Chloroflexota bacterium]
MRRRRILVAFPLLVLIVLVALIVARLSTPPVQLAQPSGALAFTTNQGGTWDIGMIEPDGAARLVTPEDGFHDYFASFDFASERINFLSNRLTDDALGPTQVQPDGSGLRTLDILSAVTTLFFEGRLDWDPAFAPGGSALVWASLRDLNLELYVDTDPVSDTDSPVRITSTGARDWFHSWSPDGQWIAFASDRTGNEDIYVVRPDGSDLVQVTTNAADDIYPVWTLDGDRLLFVSERDGLLSDGSLTLYAIDVADAVAGRGDDAVELLALVDGLEADPTYSADGKQVAVMRRQDDEWRIVVMDISDDGEPMRESAQVLTRDGDALFPVWRP